MITIEIINSQFRLIIFFSKYLHKNMNMKPTKESIEECFNIIEKNGGAKFWQDIKNTNTIIKNVESTQVINYIKFKKRNDFSFNFSITLKEAFKCTQKNLTRP